MAENDDWTDDPEVDRINKQAYEIACKWNDCFPKGTNTLVVMTAVALFLGYSFRRNAVPREQVPRIMYQLTTGVVRAYDDHADGPNKVN